jgi:hypothetical protein
MIAKHHESQQQLVLGLFLPTVLLLSSLSWWRVESFNPVAAPRFDAFAEKIVGTWSIQLSDDDNSGKDSCLEWNVEEVMRSCGGAVQGIREVPITIPRSDPELSTEGAYLNRANDGFLFYSDGSYTVGPTRWIHHHHDDDDDDDKNQFLFNFPFYHGQCRVLIEIQNPNPTDHARARALVLSKYAPPNSKSSSSTQMIAATIDRLLEKPSSEELVWSTELHCRMPSTSVPWSLQRAKWEKKSYNETNDLHHHLVVESSARSLALPENPFFLLLDRMLYPE